MPLAAVYAGLVAGLAGQRLWEVHKSRRHQQHLLGRGAYQVGTGHFPLMVLVHLLWLACCGALPWWLPPPPPGSWQLMVGVALVVAGQLLRMAAMAALGERWTVTIVILPDAPRKATGIYRYLQHPNYWGVACEVAGLPLIYGFWQGALAFSAANLVVMLLRVPVEAAALAREEARGCHGS